MIQRAASQHDQQNGSNGAGLIVRRDRSLGIERQVLRFFRCCSSQRALDLAIESLWESHLLKGEAQLAVAAKRARRSRSRHLSDKRRTLRNHKLFVSVRSEEHTS